MSDEETPIAKPAAVTKAPPTGRKFPCPSCGARLDFDPTAAGLKCPYCGYEEVIRKEEAAEVVENGYLEYLAKQEPAGGVITGRSSQTRCGGCGAMVLLEDNVATESCPFCDTHLENEPESAAGMVMPESLLPFAVEEREARAAFAAWLGSLWFAPTELIHLASLGRMSGVYLPYWTYDAMTYTFYTGERGDNYQDTEWYTETKADGTTERKSRTVTRIRWRRVSGEVQHFFDDVLVCGSHSLPADLIRKLEPWDLDRLDGFLPDYLSGFKTERYMVDLTEGYEIAKEVMGSEIRTLVKADIGGDHQRVHSTDTRHSAVTFKHLLLPVWVAVYRYHDKTFQILVNGRTGEVAGYRPWSWMKVGRLAGIVFLFAATLFFLWLRFGQ